MTLPGEPHDVRMNGVLTPSVGLRMAVTFAWVCLRSGKVLSAKSCWHSHRSSARI